MPQKTSDKQERTRPVGEVVSSSITGLIAQAWQEEGPDGLPLVSRPAFGSFIRAECTEQRLDIVAVVYDVITGPQDTSHKPSALGLTREQLKAEQPHIFALLRTEIHAVTTGYFQGGRYYHHLPPYPPQVHDFVYPLADREIRSATAEMDFLRPMTLVATVPADELMAAAVRQAYLARGEDRRFLVEAGQALSHLFREDYDRLIALLKKLRPA